MLSVASMAAGQEGYYTSLAVGEYYLGSGEPAGEWAGQGAALLGLRGTVEELPLTALFRGLHPRTSLPLVRNAATPGRRAGFDLTFSAPKSVSVLAALGGPLTRAALVAAHRAAVLAALAYIEDEAAASRREAQGRVRVAAKLVAALFEHSTARGVQGRRPDPHLHTHGLVLNIGLGFDGKTGTLDGRELFRHKMAAGALYRAELFARLRRELGLSATRTGTLAELDVVPTALLREFSTRRRIIEAHLRDEGSSGDAARAALAALLTRETKVRFRRDELEREWRLVARVHGFAPEEVLEAHLSTTARSLHPEQQRVPRTEPLLEALTASRSHFAARDVVRELAAAAEPGELDAAAVRRAATSLLQNRKLLVPLGLHEGERRYTTHEMLAVERELTSHARYLHSALGPSPSAANVDEVLAERSTLSGEQQAALFAITGPRRLALVSGMAGTGKTYLLGAAHEALLRSGLRVVGAAVAASAARRLEEGTGIQSSSLHRALLLLERGALRLSRETVFVLDEAGMVGARQLCRLLRHVEASGARLVLVGDERQLQPVEAGGAFAHLVQHLSAAPLTHITRQRDPWARAAVHALAEGRGREALEAFARAGALELGKDRDELLARIAADWNEVRRDTGLASTLVLTGTRRDALDLSLLLQEARRNQGELGTSALSHGALSFHEHDRVLLRRNAGALLNGDAGVITALDPAAGTLTVLLDRGPRVTVELESYPYVDLAYASTTHVAQGATVKSCLVLLGGSTQDREAAYVQASRATHLTRLYAVEETLSFRHRELVQLVERSRRKDLALDHLPGLSPVLEPV